MRLATVPPLCAKEKQAPEQCNSQLAQKEGVGGGRERAVTCAHGEAQLWSWLHC